MFECMLGEKPVPVVITDGVRSDNKCGPEVPLEDGTPARCDPDSAAFCCSSYGWCGGTAEYCSCETCKNYNPSRGEMRRTVCCLSSDKIQTMFPLCQLCSVLSSLLMV